ncbi:hypothetical protein JTE90_004247 [Oedothorax gibbosus]|uniref:Granulins domain-containing protein n=1 Tax=Oedothorax gibbosus TaxID=931172 RepID=A0AAV6UHW2_9ARAC|nr:hypothetical protein JTE90_004247 [Oedothorax gibbosus]
MGLSSKDPRFAFDKQNYTYHVTCQFLEMPSLLILIFALGIYSSVFVYGRPENVCEPGQTCYTVPPDRYSSCPAVTPVSCSDLQHCCAFQCCPDSLHCCPQGTHCSPNSQNCIQGHMQYPANASANALL